MKVVLPDVTVELPDEVVEAIVELVLERLPAPVEPWRLRTVQEIADDFGRSPRWVYQAVKERGLPYVHLDEGGKMFDLDDVREWARSRRVPLADRLQVVAGGRQ